MERTEGQSEEEVNSKCQDITETVCSSTKKKRTEVNFRSKSGKK